MKKLLVGLFALGCVSSFAACDVKAHIENETMRAMEAFSDIIPQAKDVEIIKSAMIAKNGDFETYTAAALNSEGDLLALGSVNVDTKICKTTLLDDGRSSNVFSFNID